MSDAQEDHLQRVALHAAHLELHIMMLKDKAYAFTRGVEVAPWKSREMRIIGFKTEYDEMLAAFATREPQLVTHEQWDEIKQSFGKPAI